jgi:hypothetical protein
MLVALTAFAWRSMDLLGDSFWTVALGRWILENGRVPTTDPFALSADASLPLSNMPLTQVLFAVSERAGGLHGLLVVGALVCALGLALAWLPHARTPAAATIPFVLALASVWVQQEDLCVRGQLFGDLWLATLLLWLARLREGRAPSPWWGMPLGTVWVNTHPSFLHGVALLVAAMVGHALTVRWSSDGHGQIAWRWREARPIGVMLGSLLLGSMVSPYGPSLAWFAVKLFLLPSTREIDLFQPPDFARVTTWFPLLLAGIGIWEGIRPHGRAAPMHALLLLVSALAAISARRFLGPLLLLEIFVAAQVTSQLSLPRVPVLVLHTVAGVIASSIVASVWFRQKDPLAHVPARAVTLIDEQSLPDPVVNSYHWGGYLDYVWAGRRPTFIDGRNYLFEAGALRLTRLWDTGSPRWRAALEVSGARTVLWERNTFLDAALASDPTWTCVHREGFAVVYTKR